jgi:hypothetical protein
MTDARRSSQFGRPVAEGTWLYSGSVPTAVRVLESDVAFGTGDYEDEPEVAEDKPGVCFYVEWEPAGGGSSGGSVTGPFATIDEAKTHIQQTATGVRWA